MPQEKEQGSTIREALRSLEKRAAEAGMREAWRLGELSPYEMELEFSAHAARMRGNMEMIDLAAWLIGSYGMLGMHAPGRYPTRPRLMRRKAMKEDQMQAVFRAMAVRR